MAIFLLALPLAFAGYLVPPETFDSAENWSLMPGDNINSGVLNIGGSNSGNPSRYVHNISRYPVNQTFRCDFQMNYSTSASGDNMLYLSQKNITAADSNQYIYNYGRVGLDGINAVNAVVVVGPWDTASHSHFNNISLIFQNWNRSLTYLLNGTQQVNIPYNPTFFNFSYFMPTSENSASVTWSLDNFRCYNGTVEPKEVTAYTTPDLFEFTLTAKDSYDNLNLKNITVSIPNGTYIYNFSTVNGTIIINNGSIPIFNNSYNITFKINDSGGYFNRTINNINFTVSGSYVADLWQALAYMNVSEIISNTKITNFWSNFPAQINQSNSSGWARIPIKAGSYNFSANASGYLDWWSNVTLNNFEEKYITLSLGKGNLTINALDTTNGVFVNNFSINLFDIATGYSLTKYTENTTAVFGVKNKSLTFQVNPGTFNLSIDANGFALANNLFVVGAGVILPNYTFNLLTSNSIYFTVYDEYDRTWLNKSVSLNIIGDYSAQNYTAANGTLFVDLLQPSEYRIEYSANGYTKRNFYLTVANRSNQSADLYLLSVGNGTSVTFTVSDNSGNKLNGALIKLKKFFVATNSYITVAMEKTDSLGVAVIDVDFNDAFYETATTSGLFSTNTAGSKIFATSITITVDTVVSPFVDIDTNSGITSSLTYNNITKKFAFTFNDPTGTNRYATLEVKKIEANQEVIVCTATDTTSAGTLLCLVNTTTNPGTYSASGKIIVGSSTIIKNVKEIAENIATTFVNKINTQGAFLSIIMAGSIAALGFASPVLAIIFFLVGLGGAVWIGFSGLTIMLYVSFTIIGIALIWKMRN